MRVNDEIRLTFVFRVTVSIAIHGGSSTYITKRVLYPKHQDIEKFISNTWSVPLYAFILLKSWSQTISVMTKGQRFFKAVCATIVGF